MFYCSNKIWVQVWMRKN